MKKYLVVTFADHSRFRIPKAAIRKQYAHHLAETGDLDLSEALKQVDDMTDAELCALAGAHIDWRDIESEAVQVDNELSACNKKYGWKHAPKAMMTESELDKYQMMKTPHNG